MSLQAGVFRLWFGLSADCWINEKVAAYDMAQAADCRCPSRHPAIVPAGRDYQ